MKPGATIATIVRGVRGRRVLVADGSGEAEPAGGPAASPVELVLIAAVACHAQTLHLPPNMRPARRRARPIGTIPEALDGSPPAILRAAPSHLPAAADVIPLATSNTRASSRSTNPVTHVVALAGVAERKRWPRVRQAARR